MIVLDASAAVAVLLNLDAGAQRIRERMDREDDGLHAPHLFEVEVMSALRRYALRHRFSEKRGNELLEDLTTMSISRYPHTALLPRIWELMDTVSAYDAAYVALAEAQTMAVTTVIMFQIFYLQNSRALRDSIWRIGLFSNPAVYVGVATVLIAQTTFIYLAPLQAVFGSAPLAWGDLLVAALVGFLIVPVVAVEKLVIRRVVRRSGEPRTR